MTLQNLFKMFLSEQKEKNIHAEKALEDSVFKYFIYNQIVGFIFFLINIRYNNGGCQCFHYRYKYCEIHEIRTWIG